MCLQKPAGKVYLYIYIPISPLIPPPTCCFFCRCRINPSPHIQNGCFALSLIVETRRNVNYVNWSDSCDYEKGHFERVSHRYVHSFAGYSATQPFAFPFPKFKYKYKNALILVLSLGHQSDSQPVTQSAIHPSIYLSLYPSIRRRRQQVKQKYYFWYISLLISCII